MHTTMTTHSLLKVGTAAALALVAGACSDSLTRLNNDPNAPATAPAGAVFTNAVRVAAARWHGIAYDLRRSELVAQHLAEVQYPETDQYKRATAGFTTATFDDAYTFE